MQAVTCSDLKTCIPIIFRGAMDCLQQNSWKETKLNMLSIPDNANSIATVHQSSKTKVPPHELSSNHQLRTAANTLIPGVHVPRLPETVPKSERWRVIIKDWEHSDVARGLSKPLKDWPPEWKNHRFYAMNYFNRRIVAEEFDKFDFYLMTFQYPTNPYLGVVTMSRNFSGVGQWQ